MSAAAVVALNSGGNGECGFKLDPRKTRGYNHFMKLRAIQGNALTCAAPTVQPITPELAPGTPGAARVRAHILLARQTGAI